MRCAPGKNVLLVGDAGDYRLPNLHSIDFRVNKAFTYQAVHGDTSTSTSSTCSTRTALASSSTCPAGFNRCARS